MSASHFGLSLIDAAIHDYLLGNTIAKHTYTDFGLRMLSMHIPMPKTKVNTVDLPFASGSVDLTEAGGVIPYCDRDGLSFEFIFMGDLMHWPVVTHDLAQFIHGKKLLMIPDNDLEHYYVVRLELDSQKSNKHSNKVVLSGTAEPFKYGLLDTHDPWLWDPFSFVDGEIISTADITVSGTTVVTLPPGGIKNSPSFIVSQAGAGLGVIYPTNPPKTLYMPTSGTYRFPQIKAGGESTASITFVGMGVVSIAYRKRFL